MSGGTRYLHQGPILSGSLRAESFSAHGSTSVSFSADPSQTSPAGLAASAGSDRAERGGVAGRGGARQPGIPCLFHSFWDWPAVCVVVCLVCLHIICIAQLFLCPEGGCGHGGSGSIEAVHMLWVVIAAPVAALYTMLLGGLILNSKHSSTLTSHGRRVTESTLWAHLQHTLLILWISCTVLFPTLILGSFRFALSTELGLALLGAISSASLDFGLRSVVMQVAPLNFSQLWSFLPLASIAIFLGIVPVLSFFIDSRGSLLGGSAFIVITVPIMYASIFLPWICPGWTCSFCWRNGREMEAAIRTSAEYSNASLVPGAWFKSPTPRVEVRKDLSAHSSKFYVVFLGTVGVPAVLLVIACALIVEDAACMWGESLPASFTPGWHPDAVRTLRQCEDGSFLGTSKPGPAFELRSKGGLEHVLILGTCTLAVFMNVLILIVRISTAALVSSKRRKSEAQRSEAMLRWLSHECRSPINVAILSMGNLLEEDVEDLLVAASGAPSAAAAMHRNARVAQAYAAVQSTAQKVNQPLTMLSGILDNMLMFLKTTNAKRRSRVGEGSAPTHSYNATTAVAHVCDMAPQLAESLDHAVPRLEQRVSSELAALVGWGGGRAGDFPPLHVETLVGFTTLKQAVLNLMSNAVKYGGSEGSQAEDGHAVVVGLGVRPAIDPGRAPLNRARMARTRSLVLRASQAPHLKLDSQADGSVSIESVSSTQAAVGTSAGREESPEVRAVLRASVHDLLVHVTDFGRGMSADEIASLFKPFSRLRSGMQQQGTGLGLWLMRELLQAQGGDLSVVSGGRGKGCTFTIALPVRFVAETADTDSQQPSSLLEESLFRPRHAVGLSDELGRPSAPSPQTGSLREGFGTTSLRSVPTVRSDFASSIAMPTSQTRSSGAPLDTFLECVRTDEVLSSEGTRSVDSGHAGVAGTGSTPTPRKGHEAGDGKHQPPKHHRRQMPGTAEVAEAAQPPLRLLLVEDSRALRQQLARQLTRRGATVFQAPDGQDALQALQAGTHDPLHAVVCDMSMPLLDGPSLARALVGEGRLAGSGEGGGGRLVFVGLTGNALGDDVARYRMAGAHSVLTKPATADTVLSEVRRLLQRLPGQAR